VTTEGEPMRDEKGQEATHGPSDEEIERLKEGGIVE
jgi:hypothetical protein